MLIHIVVNIMGQDPTAIDKLKFGDVVEAGEVILNEAKVAAIWETENPELALVQAELLWSRGVAARVVNSPDEERNFVMELVNSTLGHDH